MTTQQEEHKHTDIVVLSDIHAGSRASVCLPTNALSEGGSYTASESQRKLWDFWDATASEWKSPEHLFVLGDAIEGQARKEAGVPCWTTDLKDQITCCEGLLQQWDARHKWIVTGTGYHTDAGGKSLEHWLGERIEAEVVGPSGEYAAEQIFVKVNGVMFHLAHHIGMGTGWYRTTPMAREMVFSELVNHGKYKVDVILRGHVHYFVGVEFPRQRGYIAPCWQLQTRYMLKKSAFGMLPHIGALRFRVWSDGSIDLEKRFASYSGFRPKIFEM
jgi:hypothetical protein